MASTYTPLGVELQATGENAGTWGTKTNTNLQIIEQISGGFTTQAVLVILQIQLYLFQILQLVQLLHTELLNLQEQLQEIKKCNNTFRCTKLFIF